MTLVGMESTGVYWKAPYYLLEDRIEGCWLLNPQHMRKAGAQDRCGRLGVDR